MTPAARSLERLRTTLTNARLKTMSRAGIAHRTGCTPNTIDGLERGTAGTRLPTVIDYAHAVGLDIAAVPPHLAHLLRLDADDIVIVIRAAEAAAGTGPPLNPLQARRATEVLDRLRDERRPT